MSGRCGGGRCRARSAGRWPRPRPGSGPAPRPGWGGCSTAYHQGGVDPAGGGALGQLDGVAGVVGAGARDHGRRRRRPRRRASRARRPRRRSASGPHRWCPPARPRRSRAPTGAGSSRPRLLIQSAVGIERRDHGGEDTAEHHSIGLNGSGAAFTPSLTSGAGCGVSTSGSRQRGCCGPGPARPARACRRRRATRARAGPGRPAAPGSAGRAVVADAAALLLALLGLALVELLLGVLDLLLRLVRHLLGLVHEAHRSPLLVTGPLAGTLPRTTGGGETPAPRHHVTAKCQNAHGLACLRRTTAIVRTCRSSA